MEKVKTQNKTFEMEIPKRWEKGEWELEVEVLEELRESLRGKEGKKAGVKREVKSGEGGGERREVVVKKRVKLENVPSLKEGDKWLKTISVKRWATFEREFKKKMKFADRTDAESIVQLAQVVPPKMASVLEEGGSAEGGRDLNDCLELLKEQEFGTRWLWEMREQFVNFRRTSATLDILEFRKELAVVSEGAGYDLELGSSPEESGKPRYKFMDCLTRTEKIYWEEKKFDAFSCTWEELWRNLKEVHNCQRYIESVRVEEMSQENRRMREKMDSLNLQNRANARVGGGGGGGGGSGGGRGGGFGGGRGGSGGGGGGGRGNGGGGGGNVGGSGGSGGGGGGGNVGSGGGGGGGNVSGGGGGGNGGGNVSGGGGGSGGSRGVGGGGSVGGGNGGGGGEGEEVVCHNCNQTGHIRRYCPQIQCTQCNQMGHMKAFCPLTKCMRCGEKGHMAKYCRYFSDVCYNCKSSDHRLWSCPEEPREGFRRVNGRMVEVQQGQAREVKRVEGLTYSMRKALEDEKKFVEEFDEELKEGGVDEGLEEEAAAVDASGVSISSGVVLSVSSSSSSTQSSVSSSSESNSLGRGGVGGGVEAEALSVRESSDLSQHMDSEVAKFAEELFKEEVREGEELRLYGGGVKEVSLEKGGVEEEEKLNPWLVGVGKGAVGRRRSPGKKRKEAVERRERERERRREEEKDKEEKRV